MANGKQDELDRILDAALERYAAAEPREGLEGRVLANLRAERARVLDRAWWRWGVMAALATIVIVAVTFAWRSGKPSPPVIANRPPATTPNLEHSKPRVASGAGQNDAHPHASSPATGRAPHRVRREVIAAVNPKLDQFPSRQPLSVQELALARYVSEFPQEATLIARAQEDYEKEIQEKMRDAHSETEFSNSDQQER